MPRGKRLSAMAWTRAGARKASESSVRSIERTLLPLRNTRDVENSPSGQIVEPAARLGDAGKQLGFRV
jgi:hypothetical protein